MCGRFTLAVSTWDVIEEYFSIDASGEHADLTPRYNIAPSQDIAVVVKPDATSDRALTMMRWGLIPHWAKDSKIGYKMINAKAETLAEKPSYRTAYKKRRCLIPATGFYEWVTINGRKQPQYIHREDNGIFAFAGLWEHWAHDDQSIYSTTIITTAADEKIEAIHHRMPVILPLCNHDDWLNPDLQETGVLQSLLVSETETLAHYPISTQVNSPRNQGASLIEKISP